MDQPELQTFLHNTGMGDADMYWVDEHEHRRGIFDCLKHKNGQCWCIKGEPELRRDLPPEKGASLCPGSSPVGEKMKVIPVQGHLAKATTMMTKAEILEKVWVFEVWYMNTSIQTFKYSEVQIFDQVTSFNSSCCIARWQISAVRHPWYKASKRLWCC